MNNINVVKLIVGGLVTAAASILGAYGSGTIQQALKPQQPKVVYEQQPETEKISS
jgi:hypothetical protein